MLKFIKGSIVLITVVTVFSLLVFVSKNGAELRQALNPQSEPITELYFEDHQYLPKKIEVDVPINFVFSVHNLENESVNYQAEVFVEDQDESTLSAKVMNADFTLGNNEIKKIPVEFVRNEYFGHKVKVLVKLANMDQTIHFWLDEGK